MSTGPKQLYIHKNKTCKNLVRFIDLVQSFFPGSFTKAAPTKPGKADPHNRHLIRRYLQNEAITSFATVRRTTTGT